MIRICYCKSLKKTGKPIIVTDMDTKKETHTDKIKGYGHWRVTYSKATRRGATTILEVWD